jgi:hypothetical protein
MFRTKIKSLFPVLCVCLPHLSSLDLNKSILSFKRYALCALEKGPPTRYNKMSRYENSRSASPPVAQPPSAFTALYPNLIMKTRVITELQVEGAESLDACTKFCTYLRFRLAMVTTDFASVNIWTCLMIPLYSPLVTNYFHP